MPLVDLQAKTSKTATFNGASVDISALNEFNVVIRVNSITPGKRVQFAFEDSVDAFTGKQTHRIEEFLGGSSGLPVEGVVRSFHVRETPMLRKGTASAVLRLAITAIDAGTTVDYQAWLEAN